MALSRPFTNVTPYIPYLTLPSSILSSPVISILVPTVLGFAPGFVKSGDDYSATETKYARIKKPFLSPPGWIFPVVWSVLYPAMGYAAYRAWTAGMATSVDAGVREMTQRGATLYTIQLGLNMCFTPLYFGLGRPVEALVDIVALTGTVMYMTYLWAGVDQVAVYCLLPYIAWLSFATYLCVGQGYLNNWDFKFKGGHGRDVKAE